jgi:hypothetical protein
MSDIIRLKRSAVQGAAPTSLEFGEVALNYHSSGGKLYYKNSAGAIVEFSAGGGGGSLSGSVTIPGGGDLSIGSVPLLLHMDGSGATFVDSSPSPKTVAVSGNATQSAAQSKFGGKSAYFDGSGDSLDISTHQQSALQFMAAPFTVEFWFRTAASNLYCNMFYAGQTASGTFGIAVNLNNDTADGSVFVYHAGGVGRYGTRDANYCDNAWHHLALCRDTGNVLRLYIDGVQKDTQTANLGNSYLTETNSVIRVGKDGHESGRDYTGYIDDVRITRACRYPGGTSFTPPTAAFPDSADLTVPVTITGSGGGGGSGLTWSSVPASATASGTAGQIAYDGDYLYVATAANTWERAALSTWQPPDPHFANVSLLLHFTGSSGSTSIVDSSPNAFSVTRNGSAQISTAQSRFGGSSLLLNGTSDSIVLPPSAAFNFGSGDFTIELWLRFASLSGGQRIAGGDVQSGGAFNWAIYKAVGSSELMFLMGDGSSPWNMGSTTFGSVLANQWYHVALVRSGNTFTGYLDGVAGGNFSSSGSLVTNNSNGPHFGFATGDYFNGHLDEIRITKGIARYTANFTPPTAPFPDA